MLILTKKKIITALIVIFICVCVFFPADIFHLKLISFAGIMILGANDIIKSMFLPKYRVVLFIAFIFPVGTIIHSVILGSSLSNAFFGGYTGMIFFLFILIEELEINYKKILLTAIKILALSIIIIVLLDILHIADVNQSTVIRQTVYNLKIGVMGKSPAYAMYYKIFLKTSPLIIILLFDSVKEKKWGSSALSIIAILLSGTRGNIFSVAILLFGMLLFYKPDTKNKKIIKYILIGMVAFSIFYMIPKAVAVISNMMNSQGSVDSDAVRNGQLVGFIEEIQNPITLLFGKGYGNELMYDYGRDAYTTEFEWAYLSLLLKVGVIWFQGFLLFIFKPLIDLVSKKDYIAFLMFFCYLIDAATNPLVYSSTAFLMYLFIYDYIYRKKALNCSLEFELLDLLSE